MHFDEEPEKLFSVQTNGRSNSYRAWFDYDEFYSPMLQNILCLQSTGIYPRIIRPIIVKAYVVPGLKQDSRRQDIQYIIILIQNNLECML